LSRDTLYTRFISGCGASHRLSSEQVRPVPHIPYLSSAPPHIAPGPRRHTGPHGPIIEPQVQLSSLTSAQ